MTKKLQRLKLKRRGQMSTVTKNHQEADSLLAADIKEPSLIRRLTTIAGVLEEKLTVLKMLEEEIADTCPLEEVEQETLDSDEVSCLIIECLSQIKSVIAVKTESTVSSTTGARNTSKEQSREFSTVCINPLRTSTVHVRRNQL